MVIQSPLRRKALLSLLLLVITSNLLLYQSQFGLSVLQHNINGAVLGSLIDLTIIAPLLVFFLIKKRHIKHLLIVIPLGLIVARLLIPVQYLGSFGRVTEIGLGIEILLILFEFFLIAKLLKNIPRIFSSASKHVLPFLASFDYEIKRSEGRNPIVHILFSELLMFYYAFFFWRKTPTYTENQFTTYRKSSLIPFRIMMIHAIVIETLGIHWWLHEKSVMLSVILLLLNVYSLFFFIGDLQAIRFNPVHIGKDNIYLSLGLMRRMKVPLHTIVRVIEEREQLEKKVTKDTIEFIANDFEKVYPNLVLELAVPVQATLFLGMKKNYKRVAIKVDNIIEFKEMLKENISEKNS
jgi:hypothetical protein